MREGGSLPPLCHTAWLPSKQQVDGSRCISHTQRASAWGRCTPFGLGAAAPAVGRNPNCAARCRGGRPARVGQWASPSEDLPAVRQPSCPGARPHGPPGAGSFLACCCACSGSRPWSMSPPPAGHGLHGAKKGNVPLRTDSMAHVSPSVPRNRRRRIPVIPLCGPSTCDPTSTPVGRGRPEGQKMSDHYRSRTGDPLLASLREPWVGGRHAGWQNEQE